ncbi:hypothetical protein MMAN_58270 [Mycobacterium mantenii]|uniref:Uncharacterized protein n=1 Tax=Mycobacterium mantenii TaxID=560555 RepID=A0A1X0G3V6_MYCNT|nr:hypothetical protein [Mycobacterium mantenii]MCV7243844.1 hypothetical protein [Mycobacterium mantenii]ORB08706.1 hypothetical protein BST30_01840 [Mycobacterium mantenii]BBY35907.1 hypothetical protein MMAN_00410 [Mycobacterium mantenii]BBY41693.1 hypothetical protein MMAN_58270 [Mycobacterium mantenii]
MTSPDRWRELTDAVIGHVAKPAGAVSVEEWADALTPDAFRLFYGPTRAVELGHGATMEVVTRGTQSCDGRIEDHGILVHGGSDESITATSARALAAALTEAAREIESLR